MGGTAAPKFQQSMAAKDGSGFRRQEYEEQAGALGKWSGQGLGHQSGSSWVLYHAVARRDAGPRDRADELAAATQGETKSPDGLLLRQSGSSSCPSLTITGGVVKPTKKSYRELISFMKFLPSSI